MPKASFTVFLHREFIRAFAEARGWSKTELAFEIGVDPKLLNSHLDKNNPKPATMKTLTKLSKKLNVPPILLKRPELQCGDDDVIHFTFSGKVRGRANAEQLERILKALSITAEIKDEEFHYRSHHQSDLHIAVSSTRRLAASILCKSRKWYFWVSMRGAMKVYRQGSRNNFVLNHLLGRMCPRTTPIEIRGMIVPAKELAVPVTNELGPNLGLGHIIYLLRALQPEVNTVKYLARHSLSIQRYERRKKARLRAVKV